MSKKTILLFPVLLLVLSVTAAPKPKNVVFLIGDGMGIAQVYAGMVANGNTLTLEQFKHVGFSKTYSYDNFTTDSAAGGTALSSGIKTRNGMIGMNPDSTKVETILEQADRNGLATGIVVSCAVTHATPASYIAHQINRGMEEEIAADFLKTDVDVFIGGGRKYFEKRKDGRNLIDELKARDYQIANNMDEVKKVKSGKLAGLVTDGHPAAMPDRGDMLPDATSTALNILKSNKKGFFLMIEGSQIDWGNHSNDVEFSNREMIDFDKTISKVLEFAKKDGKTLIIITADHETGGLTMPSGNLEKGEIKAKYTTGGHSGVVVPVFAFGPGAEEFTGFMENSSFKEKIAKLLKLK